MSLKPDLAPWAETGSRSTAYSATKIAGGWELGEPPVYYRWNAREYERDTTINYAKSTAETARTIPPQADNSDMCSGLPGVNIADPMASPNAFTGSSTYLDSCVGRNNVTGLPVLLASTDAAEVVPISGPWDYVNDPAEGSALALTFASTPDHIGGICSDGTNLYVLWATTAGNWILSKYQRDGTGVYTGAAVWNHDSGVAYTSSSQQTVRCIIADDDNVAVLLSAEIVGMTARQVGIIDKTAGTGVYGTGSYVTGSGDDCLLHVRASSDGGHIWWIQYQTSGLNSVFYIMSASIADPTTSSYSSYEIDTIATTDTWDFYKGISAQSNFVFVVTPSGNTVSMSKASPSSSQAYTFDSGVSLYDGNQDAAVACDGSNLWVYTILYGGATAHVACRKVPIGGLVYAGAMPSGFGTPQSRVVFNGLTAGGATRGNELLFDGRDVWLTTYLGGAYRVYNPGAR